MIQTLREHLTASHPKQLSLYGWLLIMTALGWSYIGTPTLVRRAAFDWLGPYADAGIKIGGVMWLIAAVAALYGIIRDPNKPLVWALLIMPLIGWAAAWFVGTINAFLHPEDVPHGVMVPYVALYLGYSVIAFVCSGIDDGPEARPLPASPTIPHGAFEVVLPLETPIREKPND